MKKVLTVICIASLQFLAASTTIAQTKTGINTLPAPPATIKIDGDTREWGDSLRYYNAESKLNYSLANDKENIYIALRVNDVMLQKRILGAGMTFILDPKGKKKSTYSVTFPISQTATNSQSAPAANLDDKMLATLTKLRQIKVTGFPEVESDVMSTTNTYGFRVAIQYDKDGYLIYEAAIPLKFFSAAKDGKDAWSFNFKINGLSIPDIDKYEKNGTAGRAGARNVRVVSSSIEHPELFKSIDFWDKFYLNQ